MGQGIVYCTVCGIRILHSDFQGKGAVAEGERYFCGKCREEAGIPLPPPPGKEGNNEIFSTALKFPSSHPSRKHAARPHSAAHTSPGRRVILIGAGIGGLLVLVLLLLVMNGSDPPPPHPASDPKEHESAKMVRELRNFFSAHSDDPEKVLLECERIAPMIRDADQRREVEKIRNHAKGILEKRALHLEQLLSGIRTSWGTNGFEKRKEIERQLQDALRFAEDRIPEKLPDVRRAETDFRTAIETAAKKAGTLLLGEADRLLREGAREKALEQIGTFPACFSDTRMAARIRDYREELRKEPIPSENPRPDPPTSGAGKDPAGKPPGQEFFHRCGFENESDFQGWKSSRTKKSRGKSHSGKASIKMGHGDGKSSFLKRTFRGLKRNTSHEVSIWVMGNPEADVYLIARPQNGTPTNQYFYANGSWVRTALTFQTGNGASVEITLQCDFKGYPKGSVIFVDDFSLKMAE